MQNSREKTSIIEKEGIQQKYGGSFCRITCIQREIYNIIEQKHGFMEKESMRKELEAM